MSPAPSSSEWARYFALHWLRGLAVGLTAAAIGSLFGAVLMALVMDAARVNIVGWMATLPFTLIGSCIAIPAYQYIARHNLVWRKRWRVIVLLCSTVTGYVMLLPFVALSGGYKGGLLGSFFAIITTLAWLLLDALVPAPQLAPQERQYLG